MNPKKIFKHEFKKKNLQLIYSEKIQTKNSIGHDHITNTIFNDRIKNELKIINRKVLNGTYNFTPYKEKLITKGAYSNPRVVSIPTIRDKVTLKAIHNILLHSYGDLLKLEPGQRKIRNVKNTLQHESFDTFIKLDIKSFFPNVDHTILLETLKQTIQNEKLVNLIANAITQNTIATPHKHLQRNTNKKGVPQGLSISGTLADIYLLNIDTKYNNLSNCRYFRYVDDILILCHKTDAEQLLKDITNDFNLLKLVIHKPQIGSEKTSYGSLSQQFTYLGHTFKNNTISVRDGSIKKLEDSIVKLFTNYKYTQDKKYLYHKLNLRITGGFYNESQFGWLYFFSNINDLKLLFKLDHFVKKLFVKFNVPYKQHKIKRFSRAYYEIRKNNPNSSYIPNFNTYGYKQKKQLVHISAFQKLSLDLMSQKKKKQYVANLFDKEIKKEFLEIKKDIGLYY